MTLDPEVVEIIQSATTIAVVGCSPKTYRDSNSVARYLIEQGFTVIPVNPKHDMILGVKSHPELYSAREVEGPIDIVNIFRAPGNVPPHVDEAIAIGTKLIWMQVGVIHQEAAARAREAGIPVVMDRCLRVEHGNIRRQRRP